MEEINKRFFNNNNISISIDGLSEEPLNRISNYLKLDSEASNNCRVRVAVKQLDVFKFNKVTREGDFIEVVKTFFELSHKKYLFEYKTFFINENDSSYYIEVEHNHMCSLITLYTNKSSHLNKWPLRIIRECIYRSELYLGGVSLHAAAIATDTNDGIVLVGKSGSGKTTLCSALLLNSEWNFICNDRAIIRSDIKTFTGLPLPIRAGLGFIRDNNIIYNRFCNIHEFERASNESLTKLSAIDQEFDWSFGASQKIELAPGEFVSMLNASISTEANFSLMIVPSISDESEISITGLSELEIEKYLIDELRCPDDPIWPNDWLFELSYDSDVYSTIKELSKSIRGVKIQFPMKWNDDTCKKLRHLVKKSIK
ncbi:hypothetical protein RJY19_004631 [Vibrio alginolyticus]|nr:hypothetical protein [Vibrio alginolyticus]